METLKLNYNIINQIKEYFKFLENHSTLNFRVRRSLSKLNEQLEQEFKLFITEVNKLAEKYCDKDENGNFIAFEDGSQKIKDGYIDKANEELNELYKIEIEINIIPFKINENYFEKLTCDKETFNFIEKNFIE